MNERILCRMCKKFNFKADLCSEGRTKEMKLKNKCLYRKELDHYRSVF